MRKILRWFWEYGRSFLASTDLLVKFSADHLTVDANEFIDRSGNDLDLSIYGLSGNWDGSTYVNVDAVVFSDNFTVEAYVNLNAIDQELSRSGPSSDIIRYTGSNWFCRCGGANIPFSSVTGTEGVLTVSRTNTELTLSIGLESQTLTCTTDDWHFKLASVVRYLNGIVSYIKLYEANGELVNWWICQSSEATTQVTIYDVVGGNHATLQGATTPFFTQEIDGSYLLQYGYELNGINYIPSGANTNPLTTQPGAFSAVADYEAPVDADWIAADVGDFWYTAGVANRVTYAQIAAWTNGNLSDQWFYSSTKQMLVGYKATQVGSVLSRILTFLRLN